MDKILYEEFNNPDYPVKVNFVEIKKADALSGEWIIRPDQAEMIILNNGELQVFCDDGVHKAVAGNGIFIVNGCRHRFLASVKEDTAYYSVVFDISYTGDVSENNDLGKRYFKPAIERLQKTCLIMEEKNLLDDNALERINEIIAANTVKKPGYEILTKGYMCMLWVLLLDFLRQSKGTFNGINIPSQDELRVRTGVAYIISHYSDMITLSDIADRINVSRNECCRCFKRVLDISPIDFLLKYRIFEAAKRLYKDPVSVSSIAALAFDTGFNNTSYFNKIFRRFFECTPKEFVKMLKEDPDKAGLIYDNLAESVKTNL